MDTRELWFVCISNPDGYEYTFTEDNRLWRKNMADNDGDGIRGEAEDGVDPNRNYSTNWGLDNEGSSDDPTSETFRGTGPASEPETKAMHSLWDRVDFVFQKNDHTAAELLLYPLGYQQYTTTPDNGIFEALAGTDANSAIRDAEETFDPDLSSELYITNGDTLEDAYDHGILGFTPEGSEPADENVSGFEFQDDEDDIEAEFQRHLLFSLDLARSAADPANPSSHLGNETRRTSTSRQFRRSPTATRSRSRRPPSARSAGVRPARTRINGGNAQQRARTPRGARAASGYNNDTGRRATTACAAVVEGTRTGPRGHRVWFETARTASSRVRAASPTTARSRVGPPPGARARRPRTTAARRRTRATDHGRPALRRATAAARARPPIGVARGRLRRRRRRA